MKWRKLGLVYRPDGSEPWSRSHAANPTAEHVEDDVYRVYFSTRDAENRSSVGHVLIDLKNPHETLDVAQDPVLSPGEPGSFDDDGVSIGCIVNVGEARYLYYMGWHLSETVPWTNALGLAISRGPGQPFERYSRSPVVELNETDPHTISYPWVVQEGGRFRMWYGSNLQWGPVKEDMRHVIKYAESADGIRWERDGKIAINFDFEGEYAICRPCVLRDGRGYSIWFCSRGDSYRIRTAESESGFEWRRYEELEIDVSVSGWDSEMIEYPCVFEHRGVRHLLYCGNDYGREGFGLAVAEPAADD